MIEMIAGVFLAVGLIIDQPIGLLPVAYSVVLMLWWR